MSTAHGPHEYAPGHDHRALQWKGKLTTCHRLAYDLFVGAIPAGLSVLHACHGNDGACVNPLHLKIGTQADNVADMFKVGTFKIRRGSKNASAKLTEESVRRMRAERQLGATQTSLAKKYGVSQPLVGKIVRREQWTHV